MAKRIMTLIVLFCLVSSCQQEPKPIIAFYYWKTIYKLQPQEKKVIANNQVQKIYLRYFDIDLLPETNYPIPVSPIHFDEKPVGLTVVPVVYIKNDVLLSSEIDIQDLVKKTTHFIAQINAKNNITIHEIQIDCDWTLKSKYNYFRFIDLFKKATKTRLSATIRLHQVKYYKETKIPNVDNGVLMYYNMGKIAPDLLNSIYDKKIANKYLSSLKDYPLKLNVALPIFSWAVHIRNHNVLGLKSKMDNDALKKDPNFEMVKPFLYKVKSSNYKQRTYYEKNDYLKFETVSNDQLLEMATDLNANLKQKPQEIIFYDLDQFNTHQYEKDIFTKISDCF